MALIRINWKPDPKQLRWFGCLWLPLFSLIVGGIGLVNTGEVLPLAAGLLVAGASIVIGALAPRRMRPVFVFLTLLTFPIGFVISHVVLALFFFGVITPVGLTMRLLGRDPLKRRKDDTGTYWIERQGRLPLARYFRQF